MTTDTYITDITLFIEGHEIVLTTRTSGPIDAEQHTRHLAREFKASRAHFHIPAYRDSRLASQWLSTA